MELKEGMYVRINNGIISKIIDDNLGDYQERWELEDGSLYYKEDISKASNNITDLIEYMDILVIENKLKDIDNRDIYLFNPVRCDGFTEFSDGKRCMIINMDYIIPIKNIKVYQVLTHEMFERDSYKVGD